MKKKRLLITIPVLLAAGIALLCYHGRYRTYDSFSDYTEDGGEVPFLPGSGAENMRFLQRRLLLSKLYLYSYTLPEDTAEDFERVLSERYRLHRDTDKPGRETPAYWYGKKAGACASEDEGLDAFPLHLPFDRVTDRDIADATIIVYNPVGSGSRSSGVLTFPDTREYICFEYLSR